MLFKKEEKRTHYLYDTKVENLFICEYMPDMPSDYVKVYLYALMEADRDKPFDKEDFARNLRLKEEDVERALVYFEEIGAMKRKDGDVEILSLKEKLYGKKKSSEPIINRENNGKLFDNEGLRDMFRRIEKATGRLTTTVESQEIMILLKDYCASTDVIAKAYEVCGVKGKTNYKYVSKVIKDWTSKGFATTEDVEKHLKDGDQRHYTYGRIMKSLGFHRSATEEERRIINNWIDVLNCSMDDILAACSKTAGIPNPNIKYVDKVLQNKNEKKNKPASRGLVLKYYEELRNKAEDDAKKRKEEVYRKVPKIMNLEKQLIECSKELSLAVLSGGEDKIKKIGEVKKKIESLEKEKTRLLTENNIPIDYFNVKYSCRICNDTGTTDNGARCECYERVAMELKEMDN